MIAIGLTLLSILLNVGSLIVIGKYPPVVMALLALSVVANYFFFSKVRIKLNLGLIFFFAYLQFSFVCPAVFHEWLSIKLEPSKFYFLGMKVGISLQAFLVVVMIASEKFFPGPFNLPIFKPIKAIKVSEGLLAFLFLTTALGLTFLCYKLGISRMGVPAPVLPYKLEPILNITRNTLIPALFVFTWLKVQGSKTRALLFVGFILWALAEVSLRGSRSAFLVAFTPFVLYLLYWGYFNFKKFAVLIFACLTVLLLNFALGSAVRHRHRSPEVPLKGEISFTSVLAGAHMRLFPDVKLIRKFHPHLNKDGPTNLPIYSRHAGGVNYHTYIIDRTRAGVAHSSGITGLTDGYLFAGNIGLTLCALLLLSFFVLNDLKLRFYPELQAVTLFYLINITIWADGSITYFFYRNPLTFLALPLGVILYRYVLSNIVLKGSPAVESSQS